MKVPLSERWDRGNKARRAKAPDAAGTLPKPEPSKLRIALLVVSSAFLSGIAVVLWNRRSLERIREARPAPAEPSRDEFI